MEDKDYSNSIFVLYGSQTGNAEGISIDLADCIKEITSKNVIRLTLNDLIKKYTNWDDVLKNSFLNLIYVQLQEMEMSQIMRINFTGKLNLEILEEFSSRLFVCFLLLRHNYSQFCGVEKDGE